MAVFTPVSDDDAASLLEEYDIGRLERLDPVLEGVENTNYKMTTTDGRFVLTLFEKRVRTEDLPAILALIAHVSDKGVPAPRPVARNDGALLGQVCGRPATIIRWAQGAWLRNPTVEDARRAGETLAELHIASDDAPAMPANRFGPEGWRKLAKKCAAAPSAGAPAHAALIAHLSAETDVIGAQWPDDLPSGAIHGDYFPDNVLFDDGRVSGVIDFYFACADSRAYDLAISINAWCFDAKGGFLSDTCAAFVQGYVSRRPLTSAESAALPLLCRGSAARFTLTRLHDVLYADANAMVRLKDPAPFAARNRFHATVESPSVYGV